MEKRAKTSPGGKQRVATTIAATRRILANPNINPERKQRLATDYATSRCKFTDLFSTLQNQSDDSSPIMWRLVAQEETASIQTEEKRRLVAHHVATRRSAFLRKFNRFFS